MPMTSILDQQTTGPTVLLTGASGVLGSAVLSELTSRGTDVVLLTRRRQPVGTHRLAVGGDLLLPDLGLDRATYEAVCEQVDVIVHCAALTSFTRDIERATAINTEGTRRVLELADRAGARLVHVSTAFIDRIETYRAARHEVRGPAAYLQSKVAAEALVLGSRQTALVVRPSILLGDSRTGQIGQFQGLHTLCGAIMRDQVPFLSSDPDDLVDAIPLDTAAAAIALCALSGPASGELWLTAGDQALSVSQVVQTCLELGRYLDLPPAETRLFPRERVLRLILPAFAGSVPRQLRQQMEEVIELTLLFEADSPLPCRWPETTLPDRIRQPSRAELRALLELSMTRWVSLSALPGEEGVA